MATQTMTITATLAANAASITTTNTKIPSAATVLSVKLVASPVGSYTTSYTVLSSTSSFFNGTDCIFSGRSGATASSAQVEKATTLLKTNTKIKISTPTKYSSAKTITITITYDDGVATLTWRNAALYVFQSGNGRETEFDMGGSATHSGGAAVTYQLREGSTVLGTFTNGSNTSITITPSAGSHTFSLVAVAGGLTSTGTSTTVTIVNPAITWSNASLSLSQSTMTGEITATKGGSATHNCGNYVYYELYEGSTYIADFSGNTVTFYANPGNHTYKCVAKSNYNVSADGASSTISVVSISLGTVKYCTDTYNKTWVECFMYYYDGSNWIQVIPYYYNGSNWVECSH